MWWVWVLAGMAVWLVMGLLFAVVLGRGIRIADERSAGTGPNRVFEVGPAPAAAAVAVAEPRRARVRRRAVPLSPIGIALIVTALALETTGYVVRLTGATGQTAQLLSMDAPYSVPRLFVAGLFLVAAVAAIAGAGLHTGRRPFWIAVAAVAAGIATIKAGSTLHATAYQAVSRELGTVTAFTLSVALAAAVVAGLWLFSRNERRDRRRVLGALSFYGVAVVGLSALSSVAGNAFGGASTWAAAATFVEESGEALAGVSYLMAVLIGVAPRLVLPVEWALRRTADAQTLQAPERAPGRRATGTSGS